MHKPHEFYNASVSYGIGVFSLIIASLPEIANVAQNLAIIVGFFVVVCRAIHDGTLASRTIKGWFRKRAE